MKKFRDCATRLLPARCRGRTSRKPSSIGGRTTIAFNPRLAAKSRPKALATSGALLRGEIRARSGASVAQVRDKTPHRSPRALEEQITTAYRRLGSSPGSLRPTVQLNPEYETREWACRLPQPPKS